MNQLPTRVERRLMIQLSPSIMSMPSDHESFPFRQDLQASYNHGLSIAAYLIKPVQRITKYQLLLKVGETVVKLLENGTGGRGRRSSAANYENEMAKMYLEYFADSEITLTH